MNTRSIKILAAALIFCSAAAWAANGDANAGNIASQEPLAMTARSRLEVHPSTPISAEEGGSMP